MGCGRNFRIDEARSGHEKTCRGPPPRPLTLTDVLKVETKELLPKDAERAAFHVIKHKIANSHLPNRGILFGSIYNLLKSGIEIKRIQQKMNYVL